MGNLELLRELMADAKLSAVVVPTNDPHFCEMPPEHYARREFLTGFTGSAGTAVITSTEALLWTDARYYLQADRELSSQWTLMKGGQPGTKTIHEWLASTLTKESSVGIDPYLFSVKETQRLRDAFEPVGIKLVFTPENVIDKIWKDRPKLCQDPVRLHPMRFAGQTVESKLQKISEAMRKKDVDAIFVSKLDDIAWILNIRASDVPCTPLFVSYLIIRKDASATLYADEKRLSPEVGASLSSALVAVTNYCRAIQDVRSATESGKRFWLDPFFTSTAVWEAAYEGSKAPVVEDTPIALMKAKKCKEEMNAMRSAYLKDGANWAKFLHWLGMQVEKGSTLTEYEVSQHLEDIRKEMEGYIGPSFETIAAAGENAAVIHYRPTKQSSAPVTIDNVFLCDAGCQFDEGTTDITRTIHLGKPNQWQKECFTRVLKGHIALDQVTFPVGTSGFALDALARMSLWSIGIDYKHGTGHGVGASLCVHEGPQMISFRGNTVPLEPGMVVSNEPGYYEAGAFGIRIESVIGVKTSSIADGFLEFEPLTFVPHQQRMIDVTLMSEAECDWVDRYHELVRAKVSPLLSGEPLQWLENATTKLDRTGVNTRNQAKKWSEHD
eukprot:Plantae.Rhodophyta-Purpureofilum_apyrenoidigerum.ctg8564.p1 GENE.Plantae.Rhodophyta-Purpureofilum_apyrenoidigerum.ctg8564~~Plantae.Rhodophyta-Purpureofilum_apyrenoidigerum.ctg8564.p1  ORF type:complete len:610 (-),score=108.92 Plantae.Rhodophyta-Purpureofilum_apyrenoidigerum.ctg8564:1793-3622(-)